MVDWFVGFWVRTVIPNLISLRNALQKLSNRTQLIVRYLEGCLAGEYRVDYEVLRSVEGLLAGLPVDGGAAFKKEFGVVRFIFLEHFFFHFIELDWRGGRLNELG